MMSDGRNELDEFSISLGTEPIYSLDVLSHQMYLISVLMSNLTLRVVIDSLLVIR